MASKEDIKIWKKEGRKLGAKYLISVCNTTEWEDYPVYVMDDEKLDEKKAEFDNKNMQKINEVIKL